MIGEVVNQYNARITRYLAIITALAVVLGISLWGHDTARSACFAAEAAATEDRQAQLLLSDLEWALGVSARDDHQDPIRAAHHFFRAARAAELAGQESRAESYLIAASFPSRALDRYLIHPVRSAVFSPDSTRLLTYDNGPVAWLWDVGHTEPLQSFRHDGEILSARFNSDATRVLSYSRDGSVRLWKIDQAEPLAILRHDGEVTGAIFTADETKILSWSEDKTARLWDVRKPTEPLLSFRHEEAVTGAVFNAAETKLLTSGDDFTARLWNAKTGKLIHKLVYEPRDHLDKFMKSSVTDATFCNMESQIVFRCYDGTWLWDAASGKVIDKFFHGTFSEHEPRFITQTNGVVAI
jgi:hypothetical protein